MMAVLLASINLYGSNVGTIYAQNNALGQSGNSEAQQTIEQLQASEHDAQCVSGDVTALSCNNVNLQAQINGEIPRNDPDPDPDPDPLPKQICHVSAGGAHGNFQETTLDVQNQQMYDAHINNPAHPLDYDGPCTGRF
jgi:hypothetical protein